MIDILEKIGNVKEFKEIPVEEEKVYLLLHFANVGTPSIGNIQPWNFVLVYDNKIKEKLAEASLHQNFIKFAPLIIVVAIDLSRLFFKYGQIGETLYSIQEASHVSIMIKIACAYLNLGCYLVRVFDEEKVKECLNIPKNLRVFYIIPIGYPKENIILEDRVPFNHLTYVNEFDKMIKIDPMVVKRLNELFSTYKKESKISLEEKF
ncbi:MAG: nitroreductase family protein [Candidatus Aenigmarchaeota archaeon]|nr:nitroreductase family protein [Candidatus Aenigmarchaeota archaeon]MDW8149601.1 nitroreductase family protein [Candidatus Aenigmarchaeota archaeon]